MTHAFSLYDSTWGTVAGAGMSAAIIFGLVYAVSRFLPSKPTNTATGLACGMTLLVAALAGHLIADSIVAGPSAELMTVEERGSTLEFVFRCAILLFGFFVGQHFPGESAQPEQPASPPEAP